VFDVRVMRRDGVRLAHDDVARQTVHSGEFVLDVANGARRLRIKSPWTSGYAPVELFEPVLITARNGMQLWRGYERAGDRGVVQEWMVRTR